MWTIWMDFPFQLWREMQTGHAPDWDREKRIAKIGRYEWDVQMNKYKIIAFVIHRYITYIDHIIISLNFEYEGKNLNFCSWSLK